eukprot:TRINITY_DN9524_c0_g1_i1.p1 TRINITY_DN9524_c0_g1~~TRINITY_DN9524_c0_g1_i1.p1  ORF type:complete len:634 (+),score=119.10 TRINITY_DN9524_c0_g1_i1:244-2145(+)
MEDLAPVAEAPRLETLTDATPEDRFFFDLLAACSSNRLEQQRSSGPDLGGTFMTKRDLARVRKALRQLKVAIRQEKRRQQQRQRRAARRQQAYNVNGSADAVATSPHHCKPMAMLGRELPSPPSSHNILQQAEYYVGDVTRNEACTMLDKCKDGTYLVRRSNGTYVVSVIWRLNVDKSANAVTHVRVRSPSDGKGYALADVDDFPTLEALCQHYEASPYLFAMRFWPGSKGEGPALQPLSKAMLTPQSPQLPPRASIQVPVCTGTPLPEPSALIALADMTPQTGVLLPRASPLPMKSRSGSMGQRAPAPLPTERDDDAYEVPFVKRPEHIKAATLVAKIEQTETQEDAYVAADVHLAIPQPIEDDYAAVRKEDGTLRPLQAQAALSALSAAGILDSTPEQNSAASGQSTLLHVEDSKPKDEPISDAYGGFDGSSLPATIKSNMDLNLDANKATFDTEQDANHADQTASRHSTSSAASIASAALMKTTAEKAKPPLDRLQSVAEMNEPMWDNIDPEDSAQESNDQSEVSPGNDHDDEAAATLRNPLRTHTNTLAAALQRNQKHSQPNTLTDLTEDSSTEATKHPLNPPPQAKMTRGPSQAILGVTTIGVHTDDRAFRATSDASLHIYDYADACA